MYRHRVHQFYRSSSSHLCEKVTLKRKGDLELIRSYSKPQGRSPHPLSREYARTCTRLIRGSFQVTSYNRAGNVAYRHGRESTPTVRDGAKTAVLEQRETTEVSDALTANGVCGGPRY